MSLTILEIIGIIIGCLVAIAIALVYLTSRWRKAADGEREKYIAALEDRKGLLEATVTELRDENQTARAENRQLLERVANLEGKIELLRSIYCDMIREQCRDADPDPVRGGCRNCRMGLMYGHKPVAEGVMG